MRDDDDDWMIVHAVAAWDHHNDDVIDVGIAGDTFLRVFVGVIQHRDLDRYPHCVDSDDHDDDSVRMMTMHDSSLTHIFCDRRLVRPVVVVVAELGVMKTENDELCPYHAHDSDASYHDCALFDQ